jgi:hypothetical protein
MLCHATSNAWFSGGVQVNRRTGSMENAECGSPADFGHSAQLCGHCLIEWCDRRYLLVVVWINRFARSLSHLPVKAAALQTLPLVWRGKVILIAVDAGTDGPARLNSCRQQ